jgi:signal transduction histidine kinase
VGLAMVNRIVSLHHGKIWVEAAVDQGATFFFTLSDVPC